MAIDVEPNMGLHRWNVGTDVYDYTLDLIADKNRMGAHQHGGAPNDGLGVKGLAAGVLANRPAQSIAGHVYLATDANGGLGALQIDDGVAWKQVPLSAGNGMTISAGGIHVIAGGLAVDAGAVTLPPASVANAALAADVARANLLVNGGFEIWQRGNGAFTGSGTFGADRWQIFPNGTDTISMARDSANADVGSQYDAALVYVKGNSVSFIYQQITGTVEGFHLKGKPVTFSARVKCSVANAVRLQITSDGGITFAYSGYHSGGGAYETLSVTMTLATGTSNGQVKVVCEASGTFYVDNAMLVIGSVAADYVPLTPADDLARCLRYYETLGGLSGAQVQIANGQAISATQTYCGWRYKVRKPVTPSLTVTNPTQFFVTNATGTPVATTTVGAAAGDFDGSQISAAVAAGLVAGNSVMMLTTNASQYLVAEANS